MMKLKQLVDKEKGNRAAMLHAVCFFFLLKYTLTTFLILAGLVFLFLFFFNKTAAFCRVAHQEGEMHYLHHQSVWICGILLSPEYWSLILAESFIDHQCRNHSK